jgi:mannose-6-phosphate isomerase-like protein (cupin superfamily)
LRTCIIQSHEHCSRLAGLALALASITACTATSRLADPLAAGWRGTPVCERLHEDSTQRILRCTFPPGVGHERHFHEPHFGYTVVGGRMQMTDESGVREVDVPTDSGFTSDGIDWHEVLNVGDTTAVFLIIEGK